jgi:hypothetical protein
MKTRYEHTRDGLVIVDNGAGARYVDTAANFALDHGAAPVAAGRLYVPGRFNVAFDGAGDAAVSGPVTVAALDAVIAAAPVLVAAKAAREAPRAPTAADVAAGKMADVDRRSVAELRAWAAAQPGAPAALVALENEYQSEKGKA